MPLTAITYFRSHRQPDNGTLDFDGGEESINLLTGQRNAIGDLRGLSGAPIWMTDPIDEGLLLTLVAIHSGHTSKTARGVSAETILRIAQSKGWLT